MKTKEQVIGSLKKALEELDITSSLRLPIIQTIEYLREEPVSEDLENAAEIILKNIEPDAFHIVNQGCMNEREEPAWSEELVLKAIKDGANWQKQQMMKAATDGQMENGEDYLRIKCLSASCRPQDDGKLVKLIIIKED